MKISWGYKILFAYLAFVAGILFLVFKASGENYDLVTENYYEAELKYQDVIDQKNRVAALSSPPQIKHSVSSISIQLPKEFLNKNVDGEIYLYSPSDAAKDIRKHFATDQAFTDLQFNRDLSGSYELKLSWKSGVHTFYHEQRIFF